MLMCVAYGTKYVCFARIVIGCALNAAAAAAVPPALYILFAFSAKIAKNFHFTMRKKKFHAHRIHHLYRMVLIFGYASILYTITAKL